MNLPRDLRKMSEKQFVEIFNFLKKETHDWRVFQPELFLSNNQFILILRMALGMTRTTFARRIGIHPETLRHVEAGRKQNKIKSLKIAKKWCEKINKLLKENNVEINLEKALHLWKYFKTFQRSEKNIEEKEKFKKALKKLKLPKDIRNISKKQFIQLFNLLKKETKNFKSFYPYILATNSSLIFIIRCCLGMSQKAFAEMLNTSKDWVRHTEAGRNKIIHEGPASRWSYRIEEMLRNSSININRALEFFKETKYRISAQINKKEKVNKYSKGELIRHFRILKSLTNNFNQIKPEIIEEDPRRILIFRLIVGISQKDLAKMSKINRSSFIRWEKGHRISPSKAKKLCGVFATLFKKRKLLDLDFLLEIFENKNKLLYLNFDKLVSQGLKKAENTNLNALEKEVYKILKDKNIPFDTHTTIKGVKKEINVDFVIPNVRNPSIVIEVFRSRSKKLSNVKIRLNVIDSRFHQLKLKYHHINTIILVKLSKFQTLTKEVKKLLEREIVSTDYLLVNEEFKILPTIIKKLI